MIGDQRPRRDGWAPGSYECQCVHCDERFIGDKRAVSCATCAYDGPTRRFIGDKRAVCYGPARLPMDAVAYVTTVAVWIALVVLLYTLTPAG